MTVSAWLNYAQGKLEMAGIGTARLDSQVLIANILGKNRGWIIAHLDITIAENTMTTLNCQLEQRLKHIPIAYILNRSEFYGRNYFVDERVLEPRPESETMIDLLKKLIPIQPNESIIDIGTGSGALAITTKLELPTYRVVATDIDEGCLDVARKNADLYNVSIEFVCSDLLTNLENKESENNIILANLPYVPTNYQINMAATHEPRLAIFGGADGLDVYRQLFAQTTERNLHISHIFTEALPSQHKPMELIAAKYNYRQIKIDDFIQVFQKES